METDKKREEFVRRLERLDNGSLAALRRSCGERDPIAGRCPWFYGLVQGAAGESAAFLLAGLMAQYKTLDIKAGRHRIEGSFGRTWRLATVGNASQSLQQRFRTLLDAEYNPASGEGDLPPRLRKMIRYSASKGIGIDWPVLLTDLTFWNSQGKASQKRWARDFYAPEQDGGETPSAE